MSGSVPEIVVIDAQLAEQIKACRGILRTIGTRQDDFTRKALRVMQTLGYMLGKVRRPVNTKVINGQSCTKAQHAFKALWGEDVEACISYKTFEARARRFMFVDEHPYYPEVEELMSMGYTRANQRIALIRQLITIAAQAAHEAVSLANRRAEAEAKAAEDAARAAEEAAREATETAKTIIVQMQKLSIAEEEDVHKRRHLKDQHLTDIINMIPVLTAKGCDPEQIKLLLSEQKKLEVSVKRTDDTFFAYNSRLVSLQLELGETRDHAATVTADLQGLLVKKHEALKQQETETTDLRRVLDAKEAEGVNLRKALQDRETTTTDLRRALEEKEKELTERDSEIVRLKQQLAALEAARPRGTDLEEGEIEEEGITPPTVSALKRVGHNECNSPVKRSRLSWGQSLYSQHHHKQL